MAYFSKIYLAKNEKIKTYIRNHKWLHPNSISNYRKYGGIILTVFYVYFTYIYLNDLVRFIIIEFFVILAMTDMWDGDFARECNILTDEGASLDAEADKWFDTPPLLAMSFIISPYLFFPMVIVISIFDFYGQSIRGLYSKASAGKIGKIKTTIKFSLCFWFIFHNRYMDIYNHLHIEQIIFFSLILVLITSFLSMFLKTKLWNITIKRAPK